jgi:two-component system sensor histidine kinase and response regulator WspE
MSGTGEAGNNPMLDLFRMESQSQLSVLTDGLQAVKEDLQNTDELDTLARASRSLKGAAKIAQLEPAFEIAQRLEDIFSAAQQQAVLLTTEHVTTLIKATDILTQLTQAAEGDLQGWLEKNAAKLKRLNQTLSTIRASTSEASTETATVEPEAESQPEPEVEGASVPPQKTDKAPSASEPLADLSMLELFRMEAETQVQVLIDGLVALEDDPGDSAQLEVLMRAAHSVKGAARMVGLDATVSVTHLMEDVFVAAQAGTLLLNGDDMDVLLRGADMVNHMAAATASDYSAWLSHHDEEIGVLTDVLSAMLNQGTRDTPVAPAVAEQPTPTEKIEPLPATATDESTNEASDPLETSVSGTAPPNAPTSSFATSPASSPTNTASKNDNVVRVSAENLNRLMGLAGEALVESRWVYSFSESLLMVKRRQAELVSLLDRLREHVFDLKVDEHVENVMHSAHLKADQCRQLLSDRLSELESYDRRSHSLSHRLNREVLSARMRPFTDGVPGLQRMVRDVSRSLGKQVKLEIRGRSTQVDRDILEKLSAPFNHLIRNAIDHGIESPKERREAGKPEQGTIRLEAMHNAGMLSIIVQDDGRGIDLDQLRQKIIDKGMVNTEMATNLSESELLDFMFLPNFSTRETVTEISGRGVGLDVVQSVMQELRGKIRANTQLGQGTRFQFQLPLTLSVVRALLVDIAGETYAFALARIDQTLKIHKESIETMEGRQYFTFGNRHIGLVTAHQVLRLNSRPDISDEISVVVLGDRLNSYGIVVDEFLGERNLVVHTLDPRLGKVQDISAASLTEDGTPLLIFDADDLLRSIDILLSGGRLDKVGRGSDQQTAAAMGKRVLVVDDSITVREVERNLLESKGFHVEVAVDGMDGWNAARTNQYDLIVTDIDMPRMNGFEFVTMLKGDERFKALPVIIVSYKDRDEDRQRGLEVGADYYLTKGSFHDESLVDAVIDLIGEP